MGTSPLARGMMAAALALGLAAAARAQDRWDDAVVVAGPVQPIDTAVATAPVHPIDPAVLAGRDRIDPVVATPDFFSAVVERPDLGLHLDLPQELTPERLPQLRESLVQRRYLRVALRRRFPDLVAVDPAVTAVTGSVHAEPLSPEAVLPDCAAVVAGFDRARELAARIQAATDEVLALTEQALAAAHDPAAVKALLVRISALVGEVRDLAREVNAVYPLAYAQRDRRLVYEWTVLDRRDADPHRRQLWRLAGFDAAAVVLPGFTWSSGQGQVTELPDVPAAPQAAGTQVRFERLASPSGHCLNDNGVQLLGALRYATIFGGGARTVSAALTVASPAAR